MNTEKCKKCRNVHLDALKGLAIFLVIWGHAMQVMGAEPACLDNFVWRAIYLFHMPLFFFISGIVSVGAVQRSFKDLAVSRFWSLFVPLMIWSAVLFVIRLIIGSSQIETESIFTVVKSIVGGLVYGYWFIWVLLYSVGISNVLHKICRSVWLPIVSVFLIWMIPETPIPYVHYLKTMYPFFVMGYVVGSHKEIFGWLRSKYLFIIALPLFAWCVYVSDFRNLMFVPAWVLDIWHKPSRILWIVHYYSFFITGALTGICLCYNFIRILNHESSVFRLLQDMGKYTLIMYLLQGLWFFSFCKQYDYHIVYQSVALIIGVSVTFAVYRLGRWIANNENIAFLAGRKKL